MTTFHLRAENAPESWKLTFSACFTYLLPISARVSGRKIRIFRAGIWKKKHESTLTWARWDCLAAVGNVVSFNAGRCELNCDTRTDLDLVTDLANLANFDRPPLLSSVSIGCFRAVISLNVSRKSTTRSRSFFIGAICRSSHSGVSVDNENSKMPGESHSTQPNSTTWQPNFSNLQLLQILITNWKWVLSQVFVQIGITQSIILNYWRNNWSTFIITILATSCGLQLISFIEKSWP